MRFGNNFEIIFNPSHPDVIQVNVKNVGLTQLTINREEERLEYEVFPRSGDDQDDSVDASHTYEDCLDPDGVGEFGQDPDEE